jgi:phosphohistidine phosphatase SixA
MNASRLIPTWLRVATGACLVMIVTAAPGLSAQPSMVVLVRHAEKAAVAGNDPPLSDVGTERAAALATALVSSKPSAIIVSSLQRTGLTAQVVAKQAGVTPQVISMEGGSAAHIAAVAKAVQQAKGVVLVVGHSNTVPAIIKALGGPTLPDICDATYSHFFVFVPARDGHPAALTVSHFGAAEPPPPASCTGMIPR